MNIQTRYKLYTNKMSKYFSLDLIGHIRPPRMKIKSMKRWKEFQFFILVFGLVFHWVLAFKNPHQHGWRKCFSFVFQVSFAFISHPPTHMEKVFGNDWWSHGGCLNISFTHSHTHTHTHALSFIFLHIVFPPNRKKENLWSSAVRNGSLRMPPSPRIISPPPSFPKKQRSITNGKELEILCMNCNQS